MTDQKVAGEQRIKIHLGCSRKIFSRAGWHSLCFCGRALSIFLIVLGSDSPLLRTGDKLPPGFRPRSGGGRVFWMLMRALPGNFWTFYLKIATISSGSGDRSYLRWPAKDRNIWGRWRQGSAPDSVIFVCLFDINLLTMICDGRTLRWWQGPTHNTPASSNSNWTHGWKIVLKVENVIDTCLKLLINYNRWHCDMQK